MEDLKSKILKRNQKRKTKISNSIGVYDIYKMIRKNKWKGIGLPIKEGQFYKIIRTLNQELADKFTEVGSMTFPHRLGTIELRKFEPKIKMKYGKMGGNLPVNWDATLNLWIEDPEAMKAKQLIRFYNKESFKFKYNKYTAFFVNKFYFQFTVNRDIKTRIRKLIKRGAIDAIPLTYD
jgi:hypothetical protein